MALFIAYLLSTYCLLNVDLLPIRVVYLLSFYLIFSRYLLRMDCLCIVNMYSSKEILRKHVLVRNH